MDVLCDKKTSKNIAKFVCNLCDFKCCKKGDWNRHILRPKHLQLTDCDAEKHLYNCEICNKKYKSRNGLWCHKKKCNNNIDNEHNTTSDNEPTDKQIIMALIKDNSEFKNMMMEVIKNGTYNNNNNNTNSHNKTFNLQFFLNETCKDAMNIMDFVDSIKLQLFDLERVGELGYVEGISNIIVKNLNDLDITERPIHCTDKKRETIYIKDEDKWEKEDEGKMKIRKVIKKVASKNSLLIPKFKEVHPDCIKSISPFSDQYNKLIIESMGGPGDNDVEKENKIIRNISKNIIIDK